MTVIFARARFLLTMKEIDGKLERISDGFILIKESKIMEVGPYSDSTGKRLLEIYGKDNFQIIGNLEVKTPILSDLKQINAVILPGFVKLHGHDHESCLIGVSRDQPLTEWLDSSVNIFTGFLHEHEEELKQEFRGLSPYYIAFLKARLDDISFGITTAVTHHCNFNKYHVKELIDANEKIGTRIYIAIGSQDRNYDPRILDTPEEAIERLNGYEKLQTDRSIIIPGPDQFFSNSPELLKALKQWSNQRNKLIHIHSSEEPATTVWFTKTYGMTPIQYGQTIGFLDDKTLLAHQVNTTDNDLELIKETQAMVVHNPLANTILGSGMPPVLKMINEGVLVAISTDGSGSADNQNILNAARTASQYQKAFTKNAKVLPAEDVLKRITRIPAEMIHINAGTLETGKDADFILVDLSIPNLTPTRLETVVENLIWASAGNEIRTVVANGVILIDSYEYLNIDKDQVLADIQSLADKFEKFKKEVEVSKVTGAYGKD